MKKTTTQETQKSFKARLLKLEEIYHLIQTNDEKDLEKIIALYEQGMKLAHSLEKNIQEYELKIQEIEHSCEDAGETRDTRDEDTAHADKNRTQTKKKPTSSTTDSHITENSFDLF